MENQDASIRFGVFDCATGETSTVEFSAKEGGGRRRAMYDVSPAQIMDGLRSALAADRDGLLAGDEQEIRRDSNGDAIEGLLDTERQAVRIALEFIESDWRALGEFLARKKGVRV